MTLTTKELVNELINRGISIYDLKLLYISEALNHFEGNRAKTARVLQMNYSHLHSMIKRYGWSEE